MRTRNGILIQAICLLTAVSAGLAPSRAANAQELSGWSGLAADSPLGSALDGELFALASPDLENAELIEEDKVGVKAFLLDSLVIHAVMWPATLAFSSNIRDGVLDSSWSEWVDNVSTAPQWNDDSDWVTNWVSHPLLGATNFLVYRSRGHGFVASSLGVILQSLLLEYTIEATFNVPSAHDLVITPLIGIPVGYGLDSLSVYLLKKEEKPLRYLGYLFNPFNLLPTAKDSRWQLTVDPVGKNLAFSMRF